jgi:hypothetical protein
MAATRTVTIMLAPTRAHQKCAYMATLLLEIGMTLSLHLQAAPDNQQAARTALTIQLQKKGTGARCHGFEHAQSTPEIKPQRSGPA